MASKRAKVILTQEQTVIQTNQYDTDLRPVPAYQTICGLFAKGTGHSIHILRGTNPLQVDNILSFRQPFGLLELIFSS